MKFHDYNPLQGLALVTDDDGTDWRYEPLSCPLQFESTPPYLLRQGHYVANAIAQGLVIVGSRIKMKPDEWERLGPSVAFNRKLGAMT